MREKKTEAELVVMIMAGLAQRADCADLHIGLTRGDRNGANWTIFAVREGRVVHPCFAHAEQIARGLQAKYDLAT